MSVVAGIGLALHHRHITGTPSFSPYVPPAHSLYLSAIYVLRQEHRHITGLGQLVDVSLLRAGIWANSHSVVAASASEQWAKTLKEPMALGGRPLLLQVDRPLLIIEIDPLLLILIWIFH